MAAVALLPSLSQIDAWNTEHLDTAARHWTRTAATWEQAFTTVYRHAPFPGGTPWDGEAADAAVLRVGSDRLTVLPASEALQDAATVARSGASEIQAAKQAVIKAVKDTEAAGFTVDEDLSVTNRIKGGPAAFQAAREAQAEGFAANIRSRAAALAAIDDQVAGRISTATASLSGTEFDSTPAVPRKPSIQAVDNRSPPQEPPPLDPNGPRTPIKTAQDVKDLLDTLPRGDNKPVVTLKDPADIYRLYDWLTRNATDAPKLAIPGRNECCQMALLSAFGKTANRAAPQWRSSIRIAPRMTFTFRNPSLLSSPNRIC